MISLPELNGLAASRLADAQALYAARRFDGAVYICGYAIEIALKARICKSLNWSSFPSTRKDFDGLQSFKTHDLEILLRFSGIEDIIRLNHLAAWSKIEQWDPEKRYEPVGQTAPGNAHDFISATGQLLAIL